MFVLSCCTILNIQNLFDRHTHSTINHSNIYNKIGEGGREKKNQKPEFLKYLDILHFLTFGNYEPFTQITWIFKISRPPRQKTFLPSTKSILRKSHLKNIHFELFCNQSFIELEINHSFPLFSITSNAIFYPITLQLKIWKNTIYLALFCHTMIKYVLIFLVERLSKCLCLAAVLF